MPSLTHCKHPRLIQIGKECCKEWICPQQRHLPLSESALPASKRRSPRAALMLGHRLRRWPSIKTTRGRHLVFAL